MTTWDDLTQPGKDSNYFLPVPAEKAFDATRPDYDPVNAWWLMELSRLVYVRDKNTRRSFLPEGIEEWEFFGDEGKKALGKNDTQGVIVGDKDRTWAAVVFRGSETFSDWLTNANVPLGPGKGGRVHGGFDKALTDVWEKIETELDKLPDPCVVYYTGHSLGAALATIAASRRPPKATYTFGSPHTGDAGFAGAIHDIHRVVNQEDLVTRVPLPLPGVPYHHAGTLHPIGSRLPGHVSVNPRALLTAGGAALQLLGKLFKNGLPDPVKFLECIDELKQFLPAPPDMLADHAPINYVNFLGGIAGIPARQP